MWGAWHLDAGETAIASWALDPVVAFRQTEPTSLSSEILFRTEISGRSVACAHHDAAGDTTVIFCHGFRGEKTGPNRTFVRAARQLADRGVSSLRFDQYGSGDSDGDFLESRFDDWVETIVALSREYLERGQRIALFGQSMGASAVICAAATLPADVVQHLTRVSAPSYLVFGTDDEYVSTENREALVAAAGPNVAIDVFSGYPHSAWTTEQAEGIIQRSVRFLTERRPVVLT